MNNDLIDLARRAVASPHFRPLRGMVGVDGTVIVSTSPLVETSEIVEWRDGGTLRRENRECTWEELRDGGWLPDLSDPATVGCLLALVRDAWGRPLLFAEAEADVDPDDDWRAWYVSCGRDWRLSLAGTHCTEAAALVAALEAAPAREVER